MKIYLDGVAYELRTGTSVVRTPIQEWADNIRLDGQQKRKDRRLISTWSIDDWSKGFGLRRIVNPDDTAQQGHFWDAENVDTRWSSIMVSQGYQAASISPSRGDLDIMFTNLNDLWFMTSQQSPIPAFKFDGSLSVGSNFVVSKEIAGVGTNSVVGSLRGAFSIGRDTILLAQSDYNTYFSFLCLPSMNGSVGLVNLMSGGVAGGIQAPAGLGFAKFNSMGGTIHTIFDKITSVESGIINSVAGSYSAKGSYPQQIGSYLSPLETNGLTMYAMLPDGVWDVTTAPKKVVDTSRSQDKNGLLSMYNNFLNFKNKNSLMEYDGTDVRPVGYDRGDGLPSDKMGGITAMTSTSRWLFAAVKGGTYSHILTKDENDYWHYFARIPTAGIWVREMMITNVPDGLDRLWCIFGNHGNPGFFPNPLSDPRNQRTLTAQVPTDSGYITFPNFDGGLQEIDGAFYDMSVTTKYTTLALNDNIITPYYGINGAIPTNTLGTIAAVTDSFAYTNTSFTFGSPYGLQIKSIQPKFNLWQGQAIAYSDGLTQCLFQSAQIHYLKDPNKRYQYDFVIDVNKSSNNQNSRESVLGSLSYVISKRIMSPFYYGQIGTKAVKVLDMPSSEQTVHDDEYLTDREGFVQIRVAEII